MKTKKRNQLIIGVLCCALIFMGVGYAILSRVLTISSTANITGNFDIHFLNDDPNKKGMTLIDYPATQTAGSTVYNTSVTTLATEMESHTGVSSLDPTVANFTALFKEPGDYATFTATVKNYGTIAGVVSEVIIEEEPTQALIDWLESKGLTEDDWDQFFSITHNIQTGTMINPSATQEFAVTVTYINNAEDIPSGAIDFTVELTYQQFSAGSNNGGNNQEPPSTNGWLVDNQGKIVSYPSSAIQNGVLRIPAVDQNGNHIISTDQSSFIAEYNVILYYTNEDTYAIITDQTNYEKIRSYFYKMGATSSNIITDVSQIPQGEEIAGSTYLNIDTTIDVEDFTDSDMTPAYLNITGLDISNATYLTEIGTMTFAGSPITQITFNNVLTTIGYGAFAGCQLTTLNLPTSIQRIDDFAFDANQISSVNLSSLTNLTYLSGFDYNQLNSLTIPANVETIGYNAFIGNSISQVAIPSNVETIEEDAFRDIGLTTLNLGNATSLETIGYGAFEENAITSLDFSNTTSLTTIGNSAFRYNALSSLDLSGATNLTTIEESAFYQNKIQTLTLTSSIESIEKDAFCMQNYDVNDPEVSIEGQLHEINIPFTKSNFESNVTLGNDWYDNSRNDLQLIYTDVTCDYDNSNCVAN